jgi:hypothetical protein
MNIEYIVLTYMETPGRWCVTLHMDDGLDYTSTIRTGSWEDFIKLRFPGVEVKIHDWRTKSWRDGTEQA